jgi:4-amino-4-deoxy-L-arabinose transferase-like glycosyltransferase
MKGRVDPHAATMAAPVPPRRWADIPWLRRATAAALAALAIGLVVVSQREVGIARDETVYMNAGDRYAAWWLGLAGGKGLDEKTITAHFGGPGATDGNREHPPLVKTLIGFSERLFHDRLGVTGEVTAQRLPAAALFGVLVALVFAMTVALWGWAEAVVAALLVLFLPRLFFHAGLACFDAPIATLWFATVYAWWRALSSRAWMWGCGAVFGLALATKHNALILPAVIGLHYLWVALRGDGGGVASRLVRTRPIALLSMALLGPLTLIAVWPWLWFEPVAHVRDWITFHLRHVHYNFEYLGANWNHPPFPWHVALVTTVLTVPAATLLASGVGVVGWLRTRAHDARAPGVLLALSAAASMGPFFVGSTPIFGAEKHWAPAMPSLAIAAGVGAVWSARIAAAWLAERWPLRRVAIEPVLAIAVGGAVVGAAAVETRHAQPYALSHYNAIAGGAPGGADLGMNRQFWGYAARGVLPFLATQAPVSGTRPVYTHDASPAWGIYLRDGLLPRSLPDAGGEYAGGIERSQLAIVVHERHFRRHDFLIWEAYGTVQPVFVLRADGVPLVSVYRRPSVKVPATAP